MASRFAPQDAFGLVGEAARLYRERFMTFALVAGLPVFVAVLLLEIVSKAGWLLAVSAVFMSGALKVFSTAAATLLACSLIVGGPTDAPEIGRAALRAPLLPLLATFATTTLAVAFGFVLLVVPGLVLLAWLLLALTVVVLEGGSVNDAFSRSRALGQGFYLRNLGIVACAIWLPAMLLNLVLEALRPEAMVGEAVLNSLVFAAIAPLESILTLLLYVDLRVRKEELDADRLAQQINALYGRDGVA